MNWNEVKESIKSNFSSIAEHAIDDITETARMATLQEVGEWLESVDKVHSTNAYMLLGRAVLDENIETLKRGKMPEEEK